MGFILTAIYICLSLLSPADLSPALAEYRVELVLVILALVFSVANLDGLFLRLPQTYLLMGLFAAVFLSIAFGENWLGGGVIAVGKFLPGAIVFFLVVLNFQSTRRLRILTSLVALVAGICVVQGARAYYAGEQNINSVCTSSYDERAPKSTIFEINGTMEACNPRLYVTPYSDGTIAFRMRALGVLNDPNDLAQLLVALIPLLWVRWQRGFYLRNIFWVWAPTALFVWGIYLTHSRGGLLALLVILMIAVKDRVGWVKATLAGATALPVLLVLNFTGGRDISMEAGSDRFALWGEGLQFFKQSPFFGVGFDAFPGLAYGHTAHNSFVVCLAELGAFGYFLWVGLLVFTVVGLNSLVASLKSAHSDEEAGALGDGRSDSAWDEERDESEKWARALRTSLIGFVVAAFFLSRAYTINLYLFLGMAVALLCITWEEDKPVVRERMSRLIASTAFVGVAAIVLVYISIRLRYVLGA
jgi:hypothetical protein